MVAIGAVAGVNALIDDWRSAVIRSDTSAAQAAMESGRILRRVLWDPVVPLLNGAERVVIVPDDRIHLVNLAALPAPEGGFLLESRAVFHHLTAEREIAIAGRRPAASQTALIIGAPDFDCLPNAGNSSRARSAVAPGRAQAALYRGQRPDCAELHSMRFSALGASQQEARQVAEIWRRWYARTAGEETSPAVLLLSADEAKEEAFKRLAPGRRLLHVATHGFVLDAACFPEVSNPLLYSGLALAGANRREQRSTGGDDGILTAQEIAALDLSGVQWAVLSACDSRGSDVLAGEGVFGLQRAFRVAGAGTVVASLWRVTDKMARAWMQAFYAASLERGLDTPAAVREASLTLLRNGKASGEKTQPGDWGAFVACGDWR